MNIKFQLKAATKNESLLEYIVISISVLIIIVIFNSSASKNSFIVSIYRREKEMKRGRMTDHKTQDEPQWIVAQRLLSALTIPGFK
jgi:hypothetical protein